MNLGSILRSTVTSDRKVIHDVSLVEENAEATFVREVVERLIVR